MHQEPYNAKKFADAMHATGKYESAFNFMLLQNPYTATPGIPVLMAKISNVMDHVFKTPCTLDEPLVVILDSATEDPMKALGALKCITPEELRYAFGFSIERDILAEAAVEILEMWKVALLTVTVRFEVIAEAKDVYWAAHTMRERMVTKFGAVKRSVYQRIYEVLKTRDRLEVDLKTKATSGRVAEEYDRKASISVECEPVTFAFIDAALRVHTHALSSPVVREIIEWYESQNLPKHPFDSVYKLLGLVAKGQRKDRIEWMFLTVRDLYCSGSMAADEFTISTFTGGPKKHNCLSDVMLLKLSLKQYMLGPWLGKLEFGEEQKVVIRKNLANHEAYRSKLCGFPDTPEPDLSWKSGWPKSASEALFLIEADSLLLPLLLLLQPLLLLLL